jgi:hypothetical protein
MIRAAEEKDIADIIGWYATRKWPLPPVANCAPKIGLVKEHDGVLEACAFMYPTGTAMAVIDFTATNPSINESQGARALEDLIVALEIASGQMTPAVNVLCLNTQNERLSKAMAKLGFRVESGFKRCVWVRK